MDLIKTIEDDATIEYESDDSSDEVVDVPKKSKNAPKSLAEDFFEEFSFVGGAKDYMKDTWYVMPVHDHKYCFLKDLGSYCYKLPERKPFLTLNHSQKPLRALSFHCELVMLFP